MPQLQTSRYVPKRLRRFLIDVTAGNAGLDELKTIKFNTNFNALGILQNAILAGYADAIEITGDLITALGAADTNAAAPSQILAEAAFSDANRALNTVFQFTVLAWDGDATGNIFTYTDGTDGIQVYLTAGFINVDLVQGTITRNLSVPIPTDPETDAELLLEINVATAGIFLYYRPTNSGSWFPLGGQAGKNSIAEWGADAVTDGAFDAAAVTNLPGNTIGAPAAGLSMTALNAWFGATINDLTTT